MVFTKFCGERSARRTEFRPEKTPLGLCNIGRAEGEGQALVGHEGGDEGDVQLLPAGGDAADQLNVAGTLRGQVGGLREALGVGVVELDVSAHLGLGTVTGGGEVGGGGSQSVEILAGNVDLGGLIVQRVGRIQLGKVLCADVEGLVLGAVDHSDQHSDIFITLLCGSGIDAEQAGQHHAKAVPVADLIADLDLDGYAIGGLAVGEPTDVMYEMISDVEPYMPKDKIRYLMGVGTPGNIIEAVSRGVDLFDCVMPSRNARHGHLNTWGGIINIKNAKYERDERPIDPACGCPACRNYSRAYIRHLFKAEALLGMRLAVMHNLWFYNHLMERIRDELDAGTFTAFHDRYVKLLDTRI